MEKSSLQGRLFYKHEKPADSTAGRKTSNTVKIAGKQTKNQLSALNLTIFKRFGIKNKEETGGM